MRSKLVYGTHKKEIKKTLQRKWMYAMPSVNASTSTSFPCRQKSHPPPAPSSNQKIPTKKTKRIHPMNFHHCRPHRHCRRQTMGRDTLAPIVKLPRFLGIWNVDWLGGLFPKERASKWLTICRGITWKAVLNDQMHKQAVTYSNLMLKPVVPHLDVKTHYKIRKATLCRSDRDGRWWTSCNLLLSLSCSTSCVLKHIDYVCN